MPDDKNVVIEAAKISKEAGLQPEYKEFGEVKVIRIPIPEQMKSSDSVIERLLWPKRLRDSTDVSDIIEPYYSYEGLLSVLEESPYHARAVRTRAHDTITKFVKQLKPRYRKMQARQEERILDEWLELVEREGSTLEDIMFQVELDRLWLGRGTLEVTRRLKGLIGPVYYAQAYTILLKRKEQPDDPQVLVQRIDGTIKRYFLDFKQRITL